MMVSTDCQINVFSGGPEQTNWIVVMLDGRYDMVQNDSWVVIDGKYEMVDGWQWRNLFGK